MGRSSATVLYDPTGEKARAVKARYVGVCRGCGAYTQPRNGKGDAYAYCKRCHPGAIERRWTAERVLAAMRECHGRYGRLPSSYDWSCTHPRRRGGDALERLARGECGRRRAWLRDWSERGLLRSAQLMARVEVSDGRAVGGRVGPTPVLCAGA
ncbi:MAG: hypothetical protein ACXVSF_17760 [Solirubrobacteraceae bacterium]